MKIVFLDIDGVLCSPRAALALGDEGIVRRLDPVAVAMVNDICDKTGAKIVISSTWRIETDRMDIVLQAAGVDSKHFFFKDHDLGNFGFYTPRNGKNRGEEIAAWIDRHPEVTHYVILDDDSDFSDEQKKYHVKTDYINGMLYEHWQNALEILGVETNRIFLL